MAQTSLSPYLTILLKWRTTTIPFRLSCYDQLALSIIVPEIFLCLRREIDEGRSELDRPLCILVMEILGRVPEGSELNRSDTETECLTQLER